MSWLDFAFRLMYLPIGLFGVSIATAATPAISRMVAEQDFARIRSTLANALGLDAVPQPAGDDRPDGAGAADRRGDLRARRVHRRRHDRHRGGAAVLRDRPGRLFDRAHHLADVLRARPQPHSGDGVGGIGASSTSRSTSRSCGCWAIAASRSAPRSRRSSTRAVQLLLLRREIHGIEGARIAASFVRVIVASAVMGAVTWGAHELMLGAAARRGAGRCRSSGWSSRSRCRSRRWRRVAQLLRIQEFGEARDLVLGRFKRMAG